MLFSLVKELAPTIFNTFRANKQEEEESKRIRSREKALTDRRREEKEEKIVQKSMDTVKNTSKDMKELASKSIDTTVDIAKHSIDTSSDITNNNTDKIIDLAKTTISSTSQNTKELVDRHITNIQKGFEKTSDKLSTIEKEYKNKLENKDRELLESNNSLQESIKHHSIERVKNQLKQNQSQSAINIMLHKQEIINTRTKIKILKNRLSPYKQIIKRIKIDIEILLYTIDDINKSFDEKINLIRYLKDNNLDKEYKKEKKQLTYLDGKIKQKELEILNKELEKINKEEEITQDSKEIESHKYALEYLESEEIKVFLRELNKILDNQNLIDTNVEDIIDVQIEDKGKTTKMLKSL